MFDFDHWQEIYHALRRNKLRTFLTAFGVFWGVFMLVVMLGSGNGLENGVNQDFQDEATNSFFVWTRSTTKPFRGLPAGRRFELTNEDYEAVRDQVPEARVVAPRLQLGDFRGSNNVSRGNRTGAFSVMGDYPEIREIAVIRIDRGRFINQLDLRGRRKVAVIGARVVDLLFEEGEDPIGEHIHINGVYFKVVGLSHSVQSGEDANEEEQTIYTPFSTFQSAFNRGNEVGWFAIRSSDAVPASTAEEKVLALLRNRHGVHPEDERALGHYNVEEEFNKVQGLFTGIRLLIWIVGMGTLATGVIGVSNIMLVIVRERTGEIGVRRALGATPLWVVGQIMVESMILTATAGYAGLILGMLLMDLIRRLTAGMQSELFSSPNVSLDMALRALSVLVVAGLLAGLIPAQRAARIRPVEALRNM